MHEQSAFAALRALRDDLRSRLERNEDFRAWKALDDALAQLDPRLPKAAELVVEASGLSELKDDVLAFSPTPLRGSENR